MNKTPTPEQISDIAARCGLTGPGMADRLADFVPLVLEAAAQSPAAPLTVKHTARGFPLIKFTDRYGAACSLQMSSVATEAAIWLGVDDAAPQIMASKAAAHGLDAGDGTGWVPFPIPDEVLLTTRMHLTREDVAQLLPVLQHFVDTGEVEASPPGAAPAADDVEPADQANAEWHRVWQIVTRALDGYKIDDGTRQQFNAAVNDVVVAMITTPAQPVEAAGSAVPEGYALVPLYPNAEMIRVMADDEWKWEDVLAAAEAITEDQYNDIATHPAEPVGGALVAMPEQAIKALAWYRDEVAAIARNLGSNQGAVLASIQVLALDAGGRAAKAIAAPTESAAAPIPMILHCPNCHVQHIDAPDERTTDWANPPHRSHLCHACGHIWRPADVPTEGVRAIQTQGGSDSGSAAAPDLGALIAEHRIGLMPEHEGGFHAFVYRDSETSLARGYGATPREAVEAALATPAGEAQAERVAAACAEVAKWPEWKRQPITQCCGDEAERAPSGESIDLPEHLRKLYAEAVFDVLSAEFPGSSQWKVMAATGRIVAALDTRRATAGTTAAAPQLGEKA